jgi:hypothetical protein
MVGVRSHLFFSGLHARNELFFELHVIFLMLLDKDLKYVSR